MRIDENVLIVDNTLLFVVDRYIVPIFFDLPIGMKSIKCSNKNDCAFYFLNMFTPFSSYWSHRVPCVYKTRDFYYKLSECNFDKRIEECYMKENKTAPPESRNKYKNIIKSVLDLFVDTIDEETTTTTKTTTSRRRKTE